MSSDHGTRLPEALAGESVTAVADAVRADGVDDDPASVRDALSFVAADGVLTDDSLQAAVGETSMAVTTAETRTELVERALADARAAAEGVDDLPTVRSRLDAYASEATTVSDRADELGAELRDALDQARDPSGLYRLAAGLQKVDADAGSVQRTTDELKLDLEELEQWLSSPEQRGRELDGDADALETTLDDLEAAVEDLEDSTGAATWLDLSLRHRVAGLFLADLRAELDDLRTWADREDLGAADRPTDVAERLSALESRHEAVGDRLERHSVGGEYRDRLAAFEDELEAFSPPISWGAVEAILERYRS